MTLLILYQFQVPKGLIGNPVRFGSGPAAVNGDESRLSHFSDYWDGKAGE